MIIKIEIDVKPEELRAFLGLPDVVGIQEDIINYVRTRVSSGAEGLDPTELVRGGVERGTRAWQKVLSAAFARAAEDAAPEQADKPKPRRGPASRRKPAGKTTGKKTGD
ncbi:hypothetical protein GYB61_03450 [bacterium]|nr:hypothetical protein [bacterium]